MSIAANIRAVLQRINNPRVQIVVASKYATAGQIREAFEAGISAFGENKVQDLLQKQQVLKELPIEWHFIGHLQTNKVKKIIGKVKLIHSLDSLKLAAEISQRAARLGTGQEVLIQVNVSDQETKGGFSIGESLQNLQEIAKLEAVEPKGLMTIAPYTNEKTILERHFLKSKKLFDCLQKEIGPGFTVLSMGMSNDFEIAIEYGANMIRLGSVIWRFQ